MNKTRSFQGNPEEVICTFETGHAESGTKCHRHDDYEIYLLLEGEANFYPEQHGFHLLKGCCVFLRPNVFHRLEYFPKTTCKRVKIQINRHYFHGLNTLQTDLTKALADQEDRSFIIFRLTDSQTQVLAEKSNSLERALHRDRFGDDILTECLIKEILIFLNTLPRENYTLPVAHAPIPDLVTGLADYVQENLTEDLSIDRLGTAFQYNGQYISRRFRETFGLPLQQYIIEKRIDLARKYLASGCSLITACHESGFRDYCNFTKSFSKHVGISPKQYQMESLGISHNVH